MRYLPLARVAVAAGLVVVFAGCQNQSGSSAPEPVKVYDIKGTVLSVDATKQSVELDHEEIPGLMKAMKMRYLVADPKLLEGIKSGDTVHGKFKAEDGKYTITHLEKH